MSPHARRPLRACLALAALAPAVAACGAAPRASAPAAAPVAAEAPERDEPMAPPPFTAGQIRDATADGRTYRFRVEEDGQPPAIEEMRFERTGPAGTDLVVTRTPEGAEPAPPARSRVGWDELEGHASGWPAAMTTVVERSVTVPAGTFTGPYYRVTDPGRGTVTHAWFAADLPGAPVRFVIEANGRRVYTMELLSHDPGEVAP